MNNGNNGFSGLQDFLKLPYTTLFRSQHGLEHGAHPSGDLRRGGVYGGGQRAPHALAAQDRLPHSRAPASPSLSIQNQWFSSSPDPIASIQTFY